MYSDVPCTFKANTSFGLNCTAKLSRHLTPTPAFSVMCYRRSPTIMTRLGHHLRRLNNILSFRRNALRPNTHYRAWACATKSPLLYSTVTVHRR